MLSFKGPPTIEKYFNRKGSIEKKYVLNLL
jgi:hypothetical protein